MVGVINRTVIFNIIYLDLTVIVTFRTSRFSSETNVDMLSLTQRHFKQKFKLKAKKIINLKLG
jgi:hypothetical protein